MHHSLKIFVYALKGLGSQYTTKVANYNFIRLPIDVRQEVCDTMNDDCQKEEKGKKLNQLCKARLLSAFWGKQNSYFLYNFMYMVWILLRCYTCSVMNAVHV